MGRRAASATASEPTSYIALGAAARIPASPLFVGFPNDRWFVLPFMFVFVFVVIVVVGSRGGTMLFMMRDLSPQSAA